MGETEMGDVPNSARTALARDRLIPSRSSSSRGQAGSAGTTVDNNWSQLAHLPPSRPPIGPSRRGSGYPPLWIRDRRAMGGEPARRGLRRVMGGRGSAGLLATRRTEGATGLRRRERCRGQSKRRRGEQAGFLNIGGAKIACAGYGQGGTTAASKFSGPGSAVPVFALHSRPYACRLPLSSLDLLMWAGGGHRTLLRPPIRARLPGSSPQRPAPRALKVLAPLTRLPS